MTSIARHRLKRNRLGTPRVVTTGGYRTDPHTKPLIDWLRFTLPDQLDTWHWVDAQLGPRDVRSRGWRGWYDRSAWVLDHGLVAWCSDAERAKKQRVLVDLNGASLAALNDRVLDVLDYAVQAGRLTRLDVAVDDREGLITRERILQAIESNSLATRYRNVRELATRRRGCDRPQGWTFYWGKRSATSQVRIYDKAAERHQRSDAPHWVRVELVATDQLAHELARSMLDDSTEAPRQILRRLRFLDPPTGNDSNDRRRPTASWWSDALGVDQPGARLTHGGTMTTSIDALRRFVRQTAGPAIATVSAADGSDDWLVEIIEQAIPRLRPHHLAAIDYYEAQHEVAAAAAAVLKDHHKS